VTTFLEEVVVQRLSIQRHVIQPHLGVKEVQKS